jgi:transposase
VADWILTPHGKLTDDYHAVLNAITARRPELDATRTLVRQFADMLTRRQGSKLPRWADQAEASGVPELRSFAAGLRKDWPAVTAGLTLSWSSGTSNATCGPGARTDNPPIQRSVIAFMRASGGCRARSGSRNR